MAITCHVGKLILGRAKIYGSSIKAKIKPQMLVWARNTAGYDIPLASEKIRIKAEQLKAWESGIELPTISQLRTVAHVYGRPLAAFYLPSPPKELPLLPDFRRMDSQTQENYTPGLRFALRDARCRRETALELYQGLEGDKTVWKASFITGF